MTAALTIACDRLWMRLAAFAARSSKAEKANMAKAYWSGKLVAESDHCVVVEGNQYFPAEAVNKEFLRPRSHTTVCPWKGTAHYYHLEVEGMRNENAAWYYPDPSDAAQKIRGRIAFWKGVRIEA